MLRLFLGSLVLTLVALALASAYWTANPDLQVSVQYPEGPIAVGVPQTVKLEVENCGPGSVRNLAIFFDNQFAQTLRLTEIAPAPSERVRAVLSETPNGFLLEEGKLKRSAKTTITLTLVPQAAGSSAYLQLTIGRPFFGLFALGPKVLVRLQIVG